MTDWTHEEIEKAVQEVKAKSATDKEFRALIISNPNEAIKQVSGKEVPDDYKMKIIEADPAFDQTFTIPPFHTEELSDDELEQVAGGACGRAASGNVCGGQAGACGIN